MNNRNNNIFFFLKYRYIPSPKRIIHIKNVNVIIPPLFFDVKNNVNIIKLIISTILPLCRKKLKS